MSSVTVSQTKECIVDKSVSVVDLGNENLSVEELVTHQILKIGFMYGPVVVWLDVRGNTDLVKLLRPFKGMIMVQFEQHSVKLQVDSSKRAEVEKIAIGITSAHYRKLGYVVDSVERDGVGWDLNAKQDRVWLKLEVKGLSQANISAIITPNEYRKMTDEAQKANYRLCVVTDALAEEPKLSIFAYSPETHSWKDENNRELQIEEFMGARVFVR